MTWVIVISSWVKCSKLNRHTFEVSINEYYFDINHEIIKHDIFSLRQTVIEILV